MQRFHTPRSCVQITEEPPNKMTQNPIKNGFPATYLYCSMAGSYYIDCAIHGWDHETE